MSIVSVLDCKDGVIMSFSAHIVTVNRVRWECYRMGWPSEELVQKARYLKTLEETDTSDCGSDLKKIKQIQPHPKD